MKKVLILLVIISALAACGKKEVKQVSDDSKLAQEAFAVAEEIRNAYLKKDLMALEKNTTKEGYREVLGAMKNFDKAELSFSPKWIDVGKSGLTFKIAWSGTWVSRGQTTEERGTAIFVMEGRPLKLSRVLMTNPFRQPE